MADPWSIYDGLIEAIPEEVQVLECQAGVSWTMVCSSQGGVGLAHTVKQASLPFEYRGALKHAPLRSLARCIKSWNLVEASIGMAAINAWYNTEERLNKLGAVWDGERVKVFLIPWLIRCRGKRLLWWDISPTLSASLRTSAS